MKIVVCADNKAKIEAALEEVNSKATAHTISTLTQVMSAVDEAEQGLEQRDIYLTHRPGTVAFLRPGWTIFEVLSIQRDIDIADASAIKKLVDALRRAACCKESARSCDPHFDAGDRGAVPTRRQDVRRN